MVQGGFLSLFIKNLDRFMRLLRSSFRAFTPALSLSILDPKIKYTQQELRNVATLEGIVGGQNSLLTPHDMKRLESYTNNLVDYHLILDLVPLLAHLYFEEKLPATLSYPQAAVLLAMGLQNQDIGYVESQLKQLDGQQILALFSKIMKKLYGQLYRAAAKQIDSALPRLKEVTMHPHTVSVDEDLDLAAKEVKNKMNENLHTMLDPATLQHYAIVGKDADFEEALKKGDGKLSKSGVISVKKGVNINMKNGHQRDSKDKKRKAKSDTHKKKKPKT